VLEAGAADRGLGSLTSLPDLPVGHADDGEGCQPGILNRAASPIAPPEAQTLSVSPFTGGEIPVLLSVPRIVNPANEGQREQDNACEHHDKEQQGKEVDGETYIHRLVSLWCARNAPGCRGSRAGRRDGGTGG